MLGLLGRNNILRNSLISLLLSEVRQFAEQLLQAHQVLSSFLFKKGQRVVLGSVLAVFICFLKCKNNKIKSFYRIFRSKHPENARSYLKLQIQKQRHKIRENSVWKGKIIRLDN